MLHKKRKEEREKRKIIHPESLKVPRRRKRRINQRKEKNHKINLLVQTLPMGQMTLQRPSKLRRM
ncbi:hypothetical protein Gotur_035427 [Gossypium turneri]